MSVRTENNPTLMYCHIQFSKQFILNTDEGILDAALDLEFESAKADFKQEVRRARLGD